MPKRRAAVDSDDEAPSVDGTPASKRARTDESDDESPAPAPNKRGAKSKARRKDESESEEDQDDDEGASGEADREFEEQFGASIRANYESKQKTAGGVAEFGIIEGIELHQFMCHQRLTFSFGPQMNFIIGHNGSGKSAVLTGITVALGGKAASTGRGSGLKSFIREGQNAAEVTIVLKNQGEEAYKPKEYGKSIVINRRFTKEGNSSWKIKSKDGRVISTKKEELAAICDHMNIQVDNPMNVLTQDSARQFLSASSPGDKYKFFLRGTQLSQLSDEYTACLANVSATSRVLVQKKEAIPDLKANLKEATARFQEATKARDQARKVDELKKELAWAHVNTKQAEMEGKQDEVAKQERRLPKIQENLKLAKGKLEEIDEAMIALEEEHDAIGSPDHLQTKKKEVQAKIRTNGEELRRFHEEMKGINREIAQVDSTIKGYQDQIDAEMKRLQADTESARQETQDKIIKAREQQTAAENELEQIRQKISDADTQLGQLKKEGNMAERKANDLRGQIMQCDSAIQNCEKAESDRYAAYGNNIKEVIQRIEQTRWQGQKPLGPLGIHVKLLKPEYGQLLRQQLGQQLTSFAVTHPRDLSTLKKILQDAKNPQTVIHTFSPDLFDYRHGEPPDGVLTVLRALEIDNPHVLRILINKMSIESRVLAPNRKEGEQTLRDLGHGYAWTKDGFNLVRWKEGGESSVPAGGGQVNPMLLAAQATLEIQQYREQKAQHEADYQTATMSVKNLTAQWTTLRKEVDHLNRQQREVDERRHRARTRATQLQNELNADIPIHMGAIQGAMEISQGERATLLKQAEAIAPRRNELDAENIKLTTEKDKIQHEINEFDTVKQAAKEKIMRAVDNRTVLNKDVFHWEKKLTEETKSVDTAKEAAEVVVEEFKQWTAKAEQYCERVETRRSPEIVQRNLHSVQAALQDREKQQGATVEEMTVEVNKAKDRLEKADSDLKQMMTLNKALKESLNARLARWQEFRRHIALRCKIVFSLHLSQRGYYGKVMFDHDKETLQLKVQTDDQAATQGASRDKDPRSLSGGEKSFSTICLLLSLWESIGCPIRCLDEFDVFMDAVNRRISMKMMIDTANSSDKKQYILITPQDMNNIAPGPTVRVQRMSDPERNQGILQFAS
ncbi:p-loop containing nucleoside triphosphate hydrolase protein [Mycena indigotica]|uniref:p-loop containing nucleoside triphosphate hydrolase protein n=1 Tax=Mycena indigotica TaxID=2126181 RepID=A0A8H6W0S6_9AGAR|nr:p-loop containing nucleoside triphosphate hydrolase protein [Mycena indigotica]KAF7298831.1 p-loop containing nucleoside triphosphate hydrolase protein [Mycena indigotica]